MLMDTSGRDDPDQATHVGAMGPTAFDRCSTASRAGLKEVPWLISAYRDGPNQATCTSIGAPPGSHCATSTSPSVSADTGVRESHEGGDKCADADTRERTFPSLVPLRDSVGAVPQALPDTERGPSAPTLEGPEFAEPTGAAAPPEGPSEVPRVYSNPPCLPPDVLLSSAPSNASSVFHLGHARSASLASDSSYDLTDILPCLNVPKRAVQQQWYLNLDHGKLFLDHKPGVLRSCRSTASSFATIDALCFRKTGAGSEGAPARDACRVPLSSSPSHNEGLPNLDVLSGNEDMSFSGMPQEFEDCCLP